MLLDDRQELAHLVSLSLPLAWLQVQAEMARTSRANVNVVIALDPVEMETERFCKRYQFSKTQVIRAVPGLLQQFAFVQASSLVPRMMKQLCTRACVFVKATAHSAGFR
jgi:hypothetical protein